MPKSKNLKCDILSTFKTMWLKLKFVHNVEWGQTVLPDRYLPKMMTRSSTVVMIATAKNILKRSAPICWIFSSSWLVTTVEGMTKPKATPSCQSRFWMHYFLLFFLSYISYLIAKNANSTSWRNLMRRKPSGSQLWRNTQNKDLRIKQ